MKNRLKGRGSQTKTKNPFLKYHYEVEDDIYCDVPIELNQRTTFMIDTPHKIMNKVESEDIPLSYSLNVYQGCEHGCVYCYARNTHEYWELSAGLDFEQKIFVRHNAPDLLRKTFEQKNWKPTPFMLSGNTDCYQPAERTFKLTRQILEICLAYKHPVSIITKNSLILRDIDILQDLAALRLVHVNISLTTLDDTLRQHLEPRTSTAEKRLKVIYQLSRQKIPVQVMVAPIIPGLNSYEIPAIIQKAADAGALGAEYTIVRLNGSIATIFTDWIRKTYPDLADKVLRQIAECHNGTLSDYRPGLRLKGSGKIAEMIQYIVRVAIDKYMKDRKMPEYDLTLFSVPSKTNVQLKLF
ncbi:MAG: PA0069 family radical SAM protein [Bacteroidia bacterium]|nr:PA0069 family radical SAM protein [Bacteroidia bacterium]MDW8348239.1 PA0069 family radical SAM protein [Bacteroidia bacterium]